VHRQNATGGRVVLKNTLTDKLISAVVNECAAEFKTFVLLEKYQQFSYMENLHFANRIKKTLEKWKRPLFSAEKFQNVLYTCL